MTNPVINEFGTKSWYNEDGKLHREDGPAAKHINGTKEWYLDGKRHREDGPAIEYRGVKEWYINGERHREDRLSRDWYYNGEYIDCSTQEEFEKLIKLRMFW
jgi:hypothetical protein